MTQEELELLCKEKVSKKRFRHILGVKEQAILLAKRYGADEEKCITAALLHDITKEMKFEDQLQMILKADSQTSEIILHSTPLYHALTGAIYAKEVLHIEDEDILNAVRYHTIARAGMSLLEKIIYIADATSIDRKYKDVEYFRELSFKSLDLCMLEMLRNDMRRLLKDGCLIPVDTINAYNSLSLELGPGKSN